MGPKPISLAEPNVTVAYAAQWEQLNKLAGGHPDFTAVEIKSFYVFGLIEDICKSVEWLLQPEAWPDRYLPAFSVFASGIDLLGRCLTGNQTTNVNENLRVGFSYIANPTPFPPSKSAPSTVMSAPVVTTPYQSYNVSHLIDLRNYATHGQATSTTGLPSIDNELLAQFPSLMGTTMETYWHGLINHKEFCVRLGIAEIGLYRHRVEPLYDTLRYYGAGGNPEDMFNKLDWTVT